MSLSSRALDQIALSDDADALRRMMANARRKGDRAVADAAFRRIVDLVAGPSEDSLDHDLRRSVAALEVALTEERGRATRLTRTRQKLARTGAHRTLCDLATSATPADGFTTLLGRGMAEDTAEALVLRRAAEFPPEVVLAARARLEAAGVASA